MTVFNDLQWKPIPTYNNYEVSNLGQVRNKITGKLLSQATKKGNHPYQRVHLCQDGKAKYLLVHRLVLEAFVGPCPNGQQCLHLDSNPRNNRLDNLKWGTPVENHSTINRSGERNGRSKLTTDDVVFIREYTGKLKDLVDMFNVSYGYITNIRSNITWKHL
jgi:hypothetical protein